MKLRDSQGSGAQAPVFGPVEEGGVGFPSGRTSCPLCSGSDSLDLGICLACAGRTGDHLVFVRRPALPGERRQLEDRLRALAPSHLAEGELTLLAAGRRALACVPVVAAASVARVMEEGKIPVRTASARWGTAPIPPGLSLTLLLVLSAGLFAGLVASPPFLAVTPAFAFLLWLWAQARLKQPAFSPSRASDAALPVPVEGRLASALLTLPRGNARRLLASAARVGMLLRKRALQQGNVDMAAGASQLVAAAIEIALDLGEAEELAGPLRHPEPSSGGTGAALSAQRRRQDGHDARDAGVRSSLRGLLEEAIRVMGHANRHLLDGGETEPDLAKATRDLENDVRAWSEAVQEAEALLGRPDSNPRTLVFEEGRTLP